MYNVHYAWNTKNYMKSTKLRIQDIDFVIYIYKYRGKKGNNSVFIQQFVYYEQSIGTISSVNK